MVDSDGRRIYGDDGHALLAWPFIHYEDPKTKQQTPLLDNGRPVPKQWLLNEHGSILEDKYGNFFPMNK